MIEALVEGEDVAAYAAVVVGRAVLRRRSHLFLVAAPGSIRENRVRAITPPPTDETNLI